MAKNLDGCGRRSRLRGAAAEVSSADLRLTSAAVIYILRVISWRHPSASYDPPS